MIQSIIDGMKPQEAPRHGEDAPRRTPSTDEPDGQESCRGPREPPSSPSSPVWPRRVETASRFRVFPAAWPASRGQVCLGTGILLAESVFSSSPSSARRAFPPRARPPSTLRARRPGGPASAVQQAAPVRRLAGTHCPGPRKAPSSPSPHGCWSPSPLTGRPSMAKAPSVRPSLGPCPPVDGCRADAPPGSDCGAVGFGRRGDAPSSPSWSLAEQRLCHPSPRAAQRTRPSTSHFPALV